ncbi:uncharacterized protein LOC113234113 [Hyposmocoma kahamanoa]|uniref:uncharacterized protein LOC113234113 n=1 Tax=Hyposmocoma kahamanoa TaxID=1477025 RepID=UPI000E6D6CFE|nr:uncharacterized protein LOC113234113 [Hyposmocoma kahamanoa]
MARITSSVLVLFCVKLASLMDPACVIDLECEECVPDNMPLVTSHRAANGSVRVEDGDEVTLACGGGKFLAYPLRESLGAVCRGGRFLAHPDGALRHLLELGCQESVFEDVLHEVEHCAPPLQGRAVRTRAPGSGAPRHLATLCFDADRAVAAFARAGNAPAGLALPPHSEARAPLSLLGNLQQLFDARLRADARRLFSDDARLERRLRGLLRPERVALAAQALTAAPLLAPRYFDGQSARAAGFEAGAVLAWRGVAAGNLRHLQRDVARLLRAAPPRALDVYAGTHGVLSLRAGAARRPLFLKPGRFPVPQYVWTVVHDAAARRALALVLLNDPFVAVSEIRERVFCESACGRAAWLRDLRENRNYEVPAQGLVFCCPVHDFAAVVAEMPRRALADVPAGDAGMLVDSYA